MKLEIGNEITIEGRKLKYLGMDGGLPMFESVPSVTWAEPTEDNKGHIITGTGLIVNGNYHSNVPEHFNNFNWQPTLESAKQLAAMNHLTNAYNWAYMEVGEGFVPGVGQRAYFPMWDYVRKEFYIDMSTSGAPCKAVYSTEAKAKEAIALLNARGVRG